MLLCTGHCNLSSKIRVTRSQNYEKSSCHIGLRTGNYVINIIGYVRDIPESDYFYFKLLIMHCDINSTVLWPSYFTDQEDV